MFNQKFPFPTSNSSKLKESVVDVILKKLESIDKKVDGIQKEKGGGQKNAVEGSERSDDLDKKFKESSTVGEFEVVLESINFKISKMAWMGFSATFVLMVLFPTGRAGKLLELLSTPNLWRKKLRL